MWEYPVKKAKKRQNSARVRSTEIFGPKKVKKSRFWSKKVDFLVKKVHFFTKKMTKKSERI